MAIVLEATTYNTLSITHLKVKWTGLQIIPKLFLKLPELLVCTILNSPKIYKIFVVIGLGNERFIYWDWEIGISQFVIYLRATWEQESDHFF